MVLKDKLEEACHVLFGPEIAVSDDFLSNSLRETGVKKAYRRMALITHPDSVQNSGGVSFLDVKNAYEQLLEFLRKPVHQPVRRPETKKPAAAKQKKRPASVQTSTGMRTIPARTLRIGEFLYFNGVISLRTLVDSITWQQASRPRFGELAIRKGLLTSEQIHRVVLARRYPEKLGDAASRIGVLEPEEVARLLAQQQALQRKIGCYFIEKNDTDAYHLFYYLNELKKHNQQYSDWS